MLVVDDEPDNLDLLYRTFRRQFNVYKAESGIDALEVLKDQGEVAVIISDQRMPEMKGTEFLRRTVPDYPDTVRIILTGFTDVEDLVDAINAGQVYKYITKPWDPEKLKDVVEHAASSYEDHKQRSLEVRRSKAQVALTTAIFGALQGEGSSLTALSDAFRERFLSDSCGVIMIQDGKASAVAAEGDLSWLQVDPMVEKAIAQGETVAVDNIGRSEEWKDVEQYGSANVAAQVIVPGFVGGECAIALAFQWANAAYFEPEELKQMNLSAKQLALVVSSAS
ncbi:MAG: response regulator [Cyanobacteria bacterium P01_C01_bin.89]